MEQPLLIDTEHLKQVVVELDKSYTDDGFQPILVDRTYNFAVNILHRFMGDNWYKKHVLPTNNMKSRYFNKPGELSHDYNRKTTHRLIRVSEMLFNFQAIPGFSRLHTSLKTDHMGIESNVAELEGAVMLYRAGVPFTFIEPVGQRGRDYDIGIVLNDGSVAAAEIECKIEGNPLSMLESSFQKILQASYS